MIFNVHIQAAHLSHQMLQSARYLIRFVQSLCSSWYIVSHISKDELYCQKSAHTYDVDV